MQIFILLKILRAIFSHLVFFHGYVYRFFSSLVISKAHSKQTGKHFWVKKRCPLSIYFLFLLKITIIRNNLSYINFKKELHPFKVFSLSDIRKVFLHFDSRRLIEWQRKGYLAKVINKWYLFTDIPVTENLLYRISNCIYRPSYLSLESALAFHHLIPEAVYSQQAVTTLKSITYNTAAGSFNYRKIKPGLFFGYQVLHLDGLPALMADMEKALLDFLYFQSGNITEENLMAFRLNITELQHSLNWDKMAQYATVYNSNILNRRIGVLHKIINHVNAS